MIVFFFFQAEDGIRDWNCDWSSDVCSSDLAPAGRSPPGTACRGAGLLAEGLPVREIGRRPGLDRKTAGKSPVAPARRNCWSRPPTGLASSTRSAPTSTSGGTTASRTPPSCAPNCRPRAGKAAFGGLPIAEQFRPAGGQTRAAKTPQPAPAPAAPPPPKPAGWLITRPDHLDETSAAHLDQVLARSPGWPPPPPGPAQR